MSALPSSPRERDDRAGFPPELETNTGFVTDLSEVVSFTVGLEQGVDGSVLAHGLSLPGCVGAGPNAEAALSTFADQLAAWLRFLGTVGEGAPPVGQELSIVVEEWVASEADVAGGQSGALFDADLRPLAGWEVDVALRRLGDLRGRLLRELRAGHAALDGETPQGWTARRVAEELARAQWWTLTRLGASPLAEVPAPTLRRLDTAMALTVQQFTRPPASIDCLPLDLDGEFWTQRKVLRSLLALEWSLGGTAIEILRSFERGAPQVR